jgi:hypothetical protein
MRAVAVLVVAAACGARVPVGADAVDPTVSDASAPCDPLAQLRCDSGQKCTWIRVATSGAELGAPGCVVDGTVAAGGAWVYGANGAVTGYDDCAAGLICEAPPAVDQAMGTCAVICDVLAPAGTPESCPAGFTCVRHAGYFSNPGDPMTEFGLCDPM